MKAKSTAVAKKRVGRPSMEQSVTQLKAKMQFHMTKSALRYIALQQMNRGVDRLNRKIDRLRRELEKRDVANGRLAAHVKKLIGERAAADGAIPAGNSAAITGIAVEQITHDISKIVMQVLSGEARVVSLPRQ